ncbi:MAG TPA: PilZ domain-containing protein [Bacillota bacterium]|nr:PilZ domain-containing protein [Bacillota bacterium]
MLKKPWKPGAVWVTSTVFISAADPAYSGANQTWELVKAFAEAIRYQESYYLPYAVIVGVLAFMALAAAVVTACRRKKSAAGFFELKSDEKQRRNWFRLPLAVELFYAPAGTEDFKKGRIVDLSGGGLRFSAGQPLQPDTRLRLCFELGDHKLDLAGRVVRVAETAESSGKSTFLIGVEFTGIKTGEQDHIVGFLLREQQLSR